MSRIHNLTSNLHLDNIYFHWIFRPRFAEGCCGYGQDLPGSLDGRTGTAGHGAIDMSWLSNYTEDIDNFLMCLGWNRTAANFIVLADKDLWGEQHGVIHGHSTAFNKIWTMGQDNAHGWSQTVNEWGGCFVELQIGVAPTQMHTFPLEGHSSHHHTEYWQLMDGLASEAGEKLYADDYKEAVDAVTDYINSPKGVNGQAWHDMDSFVRAVSEAPLSLGGAGAAVHNASDDAVAGVMLFNASAWGALDALLLPSIPVPQSVRFLQEPHTAYAHEDTRPWAELLQQGTFSPATLAREPTTFVAGGNALWLTKLVESGARQGWTWLHHLHVAFEAAERYDLPSAAHHFNASLALKRNPQALRGLAVTSVGAPTRRRFMEDAWQASLDVEASDPAAHSLRTNIASELSFILRAQATDPATPAATAAGLWAALAAKLKEFEAAFGLLDALGSTTAGDEFAVARASVALAHDGDPQGTLAVLRSHGVFAHYPHGLRVVLVGLWLSAQLKIAEAAKGSPLTHIEQKRIKYDPALAPPVRNIMLKNKKKHDAPPPNASALAPKSQHGHEYTFTDLYHTIPYRTIYHTIPYIPYHTIPYHTMPYHIPYHTIPYHTIPLHNMGVLPSTQPVATLGSSFILSSFDVACTCCVPYVEATVFGVDSDVAIPYHTIPCHTIRTQKTLVFFAI